MKISSAVLEPNINHLKSAFEELYREIGFNAQPEALDLKSNIQSHLRQLSELKADVMGLEEHSELLVPSYFHGTYKTIKFELRCAQRIWNRINSNQSRVRRMQERRTHAASFAA